MVSGRPETPGVTGTTTASFLGVVAVPLHQLDPDLPVPGYARPGDAGADLYAREDAYLPAGGGRALVPTGIVIALPPGYGGFVQRQP